MEKIIDLFNKTLEDLIFSRTEKRALKNTLKEIGLNKQQRDFMRSKIFDMARNVTSSEQSIAAINWLETANKVLLNTGESNSQTLSEAYFSPGDDCLNAILDQMNQAIGTVRICVFTISDNRLSEAIVNCHKRNINIKIITDNDKTFDKGSDIHWLYEKGIDIRIDNTDNHMHHKFAVIDKKILLTGSYNWTRSAAKYNQENLLVTNDAKAVKQYQTEFDKLWTRLVPYR
ncbi:phospholipase D-like domain-containing protein [Fulvivirgaceae bacterium BMA10]|uniref:phospholipase D n=1 Tax=Splendidivirga corallicola TaxID=3051826 RepID=A0ABT8KK64_9BACT|nr:phospholipase D-like domain-containing protein [Fulvivirgaceae bacterium BMA10]